MQSHFFKRKTAEFTLAERQMICAAPWHSQEAVKAAIRREKEERSGELYRERKLRSSGLWNGKDNKTTLKVYRISELTPEQRAEMGL